MQGNTASNTERLLLYGAVAIVLVLIGVATASYLSLRHVIASSDEAALQAATAMTRAGQLQAAIERKVASSRGFLLSRSPDFESAMREARANALRHLEALKAHVHSARGTALLADIARLEAEHQTTAESLIAERRGASVQAVLGRFETELYPKRRQLDLALAAFVGYLDAEWETARRHSAMAARNATRYLLGSALLGLVAILTLTGRLLRAFFRVRRSHQAETRASAEARQAQIRYQDLVEGLDGGIVWESDAQTLRPVYVSPRTLPNTGVPPEEWLENPKFWEQRIPEEDQPAFFGNVRRAVASGAATSEESRWSQKTETIEHRFIGKDGTIYWMQTGVHAVKDGPNCPVIIRGLSVDISDTKAMQQNIERSQELFSTTVNAAPNMMLMVARDGKIRLANKQAEKLTGYSASELVGMQVERLVPVACRVHHAGFREGFHKAPTPRQMGTGRDLHLVRKDGESVPVEIGLTPAVTTEGPVVITSVVDVSERKAHEARLSAVADDLARSNRDLENFAAMASHDLQEPLRVVTSYLELLERRTGRTLDDEEKRYVQFAVQASKRMRELVATLLEYAKAGTRPAKLRKLDMNEALDKARQNLKTAIEESNARVEYSELPVICGDSVQIVQLLQNLISNAIKFRRPGSMPRIEVSSQPRDRHYQFSIRDNGIGLPMEKREDVFGVFRKLHAREEYPGTGLGLAICRRIVNRHGGEIWVESSAEGKGTEFCFTLPAPRPGDEAIRNG